MKYDHKYVEGKWRKAWGEKPINTPKEGKKNYYCLDMFPYPSGNGLHVGHWRGYVLSDVWSRYQVLKGYYVLHPMGWDAFGLPAENYAIQKKVHPVVATAENVANFKRQLHDISAIYDWNKEINTTDPHYYKWTQWIFLKMFENGLAYEKEMPINWCPSCKTGLANEEVKDGTCDRCGSTVTKKNLRQWMLKITKYAERLLNDLEGLDWPEKVKKMQSDWIGKSYGAEIDFEIEGTNEKIKVFTTRPDTLYGATFMVLAPEHELISKITTDDQKEAVEKYVFEASTKSSVDRMADKEKTGVFLGTYAINPLNGKRIPVWTSDYVLADYGTGAIMCVPAHDERDFAFATKFNLPIIQVISKTGEIEELKEAYTEEGIMVNSGEFNGMKSQEAKVAIPSFLEEKNIGKKTVNYKLRDWVFSRQRYWGEPIPVVHCEKCGVVGVKEEDLPIRLPEVESYEPTGTGESPLAAIESFVNTICPKCGGEAKRETNTMPQWAGSCWYYLRFIDPNNNSEIINKKDEEHFMPIDLYVGGAEHAVLHLLYARFWHKFLYDIKVVSQKEPFKKLRNVGLILAHDGQKMSKSKGNTVSSEEIINEFGVDTLRVYEMFMGPFFDAIAWNMQGVKGVSRFLNRFWNLCINCKENNIESSKDILREEHILIKKVGEDLKEMKFNTAIAFFMEFLNFAEKRQEEVSRNTIENILKLFYPFAPHMCEELWNILGKENYIHEEKWPEYDESLIIKDVMELVVQINGKIRDKIEVGTNLLGEDLKKIALNSEKVQKWINEKEIKKIIFIPPKLISIVI